VREREEKEKKRNGQKAIVLMCSEMWNGYLDINQTVNRWEATDVAREARSPRSVKTQSNQKITIQIFKLDLVSLLVTQMKFKLKSAYQSMFYVPDCSSSDD